MLSYPTLLKKIPTEVTVHRTLTLDLPFGIKKGIKRLITRGAPPVGKAAAAATAGKPSFLKRILGDVLLPDPQVTQYPVLTCAARRIIRERSIDLVLITAPPFSTILLVGNLRKQFTDLAIVVNFRDEWRTTALTSSAFSSAATSAPAPSPTQPRQAP